MKTVARTSLGALALLSCFSSSVHAQLEETTVVIEGCLTPGLQAGYFVLADDVTGSAISVVGLAGLAQHSSNHRERLTGRYGPDDANLFTVEGQEHLADTCRPLYERVTQRVDQLVSDLRRKAALGFRLGLALDPELMLIGAHAEFATGITNLLFRPNIEFGLGQVTAEYAANAEGVYRIPFTRERGGQLEVWHAYVGGGPSITVFNNEFRERDFNQTNEGNLFTFDDRDTVVGFNILVGLEQASGFFVEMKAGAYGNPSARVLVGFTF